MSHRTGSSPRPLPVVLRYSLFGFSIPYPTLHLFCYKVKVLRRPIEVTDGSGHSIYYSSCARVNNLVSFLSNGIVAQAGWHGPAYWPCLLPVPWSFISFFYQAWKGYAPKYGASVSLHMLHEAYRWNFQYRKRYEFYHPWLNLFFRIIETMPLIPNDLLWLKTLHTESTLNYLFFH